jgi:hypothetical protein
VSLAARVARLVRANLAGRFGGVNRKEVRTPYSRSGRDSGTECPSEPPLHLTIDPTLAGYYANLELPYGAGREAVRSARRRLLSHYHPDRFPSDHDKARLANDLVQRLNHAHDELIKHLEKENHA